MAVKFYVFLAVGARGLNQVFALSNKDLRAHDVDARHLFCHRMLDLYAGVYLNEIELFIVHIHQKFDGPGTFVIYMGADLFTQCADARTLDVR